MTQARDQAFARCLLSSSSIAMHFFLSEFSPPTPKFYTFIKMIYRMLGKMFMIKLLAQAVELLGAYMSKLERQTYESRARLDSGVDTK